MTIAFRFGGDGARDMLFRAQVTEPEMRPPPSAGDALAAEGFWDGVKPTARGRPPSPTRDGISTRFTVTRMSTGKSFG